MASIPLTKPQVRGLKALYLAERRFVPLHLGSAVREDIADELAALGLAECGDFDARFAEWGYPTGYRLTKAGWGALEDRRSR